MTGVWTWKCSACGASVPGDSSHTCPAAGGSSTPYAVPTYSTSPRKYRIRGTISPQDRMGKFYDVDLVVEALP